MPGRSSNKPTDARFSTDQTCFSSFAGIISSRRCGTYHILLGTAVFRPCLLGIPYHEPVPVVSSPRITPVWCSLLPVLGPSTPGFGTAVALISATDNSILRCPPGPPLPRLAAFSMGSIEPIGSVERLRLERPDPIFTNARISIAALIPIGCVKRAFLVDALVRVGSKKISLRLDQVRGQPFGAESVEICQRR